MLVDDRDGREREEAPTGPTVCLITRPFLGRVIERHDVVTGPGKAGYTWYRCERADTGEVVRVDPTDKPETCLVPACCWASAGASRAERLYAAYCRGDGLVKVFAGKQEVVARDPDSWNDLPAWSKLQQAADRVHAGGVAVGTETEEASRMRTLWARWLSAAAVVDPPKRAGMNFGEALAAMKDGKRVCRAGWNGKGMWVWRHMPAVGDEMTEPCTLLRTAQGGVIAWTVSQADLYAEDWAVLPPVSVEER